MKRSVAVGFWRIGVDVQWRNGWSVAVEDGRVVTRKPDGTEHVIRRWDHTPPGG